MLLMPISSSQYVKWDKRGVFFIWQTQNGDKEWKKKQNNPIIKKWKGNIKDQIC